MATLITHALAAGALASIAPRDIPKVRLVICLAVLAALPDLDVIGYRMGIPYGDIYGHRGFSHSLLFAICASFIVALVAFRSVGTFSRGWWGVLLLLFLGTASHGFLDAFSSAGHGIGFFLPFDETRYFFPWRPLVAPPLSVRAFFDGRVIPILTNELIWVGIPVLSTLILRIGITKLRKRTPTSM